MILPLWCVGEFPLAEGSFAGTEGEMDRQTCASNKTPSALSLNKKSQTIAKVFPPKVRIIHIFAPEIIKTDAENFRELVQRLTGKPTNTNSTRKKARNLPSGKDSRIESASAKKAELAMRTGFNASGFRERIKGEEEIWSGANSGGGFLNGFGDQLDGFMQEFNQFPLENVQMDAYGESQLAQVNF